MSFQEKILTCVDCGKQFTFTVEEQEFFASKGFTNEPKRCPECRRIRKSERYGGNANQHNNGTRQMYPAICAQCGKETMVPFKPRGDKPVYCQECYNKMKNPAV